MTTPNLMSAEELAAAKARASAAAREAGAYSDDHKRQADFIAGFYAGVRHSARQAIQPIVDRDRVNEGMPGDSNKPAAVTEESVGARIVREWSKQGHADGYKVLADRIDSAVANALASRQPAPPLELTENEASEFIGRVRATRNFNGTDTPVVFIVSSKDANTALMSLFRNHAVPIDAEKAGRELAERFRKRWQGHTGKLYDCAAEVFTAWLRERGLGK